ncbi:MAG: carbamoyltransferase HypF [Acidobacteriota bacterium]|nr:carbamoyltransferase HypF [Acidobacteriota bacterium]
MKNAARRILVSGVVQGVGFRPFVHRLAAGFGLSGWVQNTAAGVEIHVEGRSAAVLDRFARAIRDEHPPLAVIDSLACRAARCESPTGFEVRASRGGEAFVFISPDISVCEDCRRDIADPRDRRYRYPFTNCTNCGPRYTIVRSLPYDRPATTMAGFPMCPDCAAEYDDVNNRRHHAQPTACPACGPTVRLRKAGSRAEIPGGIEAAAELIRRGRIVAVKGLGGFHLVCDPRQARAVARLRRIKERSRKPLALMARDMAAVRRIARISPAEATLLCSPRRPIVLLRKKADLPGIAPGLGEVGVMLPYTPLHVLLLESLDLIVATSSNPKDAPIMKDEEESLDGLCDYVLGHNRPIQMRADDTVLKAVGHRPLFVRRARGFVPEPQRLPAGLDGGRQVLAVGAELKDTVSIARSGRLVTSQFLGDLDEYRNHRYFEETADHLLKLFSVRPDCVVSDLHPDFHSTRWAERFARRAGIPHLRVQHHHAHILAALLEHGIPAGTTVLGAAFDGYGYGADGSAWGAEFLTADYRSFRRLAHFEPVPLPGGDLAARQPWRMALAYLERAGISATPGLGIPAEVSPAERKAVLAMIAHSSHAPLASSCGRLFDAVSAILGTAPVRNDYEAEAAMRLETAAASGRAVRRYPFTIAAAESGREGPRRIGFGSLIRAVAADRAGGVPVPDIAASFHAALARVIVETAKIARADQGIGIVALVGGVFLNKILLQRAEAGLLKAGFRVLRPVRYSPNDESISIGQAAFALANLNR